jgi:TRAP transporter TAXI family solute receptor
MLIICIVLSSLLVVVAKENPENVVIVSGNSAGTYYYIAAGQSKILGEYIKDLNFTTESTTGAPTENMVYVARKINTLGIVTADGMYNALNGIKDRGFKKPLENLTAIQAGHKLVLYIATLSGNNINTISDLKGKKVGIPMLGNTAYYQTMAILEQYGIDSSHIKTYPMTYSEQTDAVKDGILDAMIIAGGIPVAGYMDLSTTKNAKLLSIDPEKIDQITKAYPYWSIGKIPAGTYKGQNEDVNVILADILIVCNSELDDEIVYKITKALNEHTDELAEIHSSGKYWSLETTKPIIEKGVVPFHPGAMKYYKEVFSDIKG